ncbi:hypothetical protein AB0Q95_37295 [Streptomyces sp. NPDC059900]|uniref:hypothetical protein n=1 Tax=Streptomyces sp. NPDC059900 TaxID=3155816 RepID=UPI0034271561
MVPLGAQPVGRLPPLRGAVETACTATGFAYFAHALTPAPEVRFDRNYLDLRDGESATLRVSALPAGFGPAALEVRSRRSGDGPAVELP